MTGSMLSLSLTWVMLWTPAIFARLIGGVYVDGWNRRKTMVFVAFIQSILFTMIALILSVGLLSVWIIYVASALMGGLVTFFDLFSEAFLPSLLQKKEIMTANSILQSTLQTLGIVGPTVGGFYVTVFGSVQLYSLMH